jgi:hypothetical protein
MAKAETETLNIDLFIGNTFSKFEVCEAVVEDRILFLSGQTWRQIRIAHAIGAAWIDEALFAR